MIAYAQGPGTTHRPHHWHTLWYQKNSPFVNLIASYRTPYRSHCVHQRGNSHGNLPTLARDAPSIMSLGCPFPSGLLDLFPPPPASNKILRWGLRKPCALVTSLTSLFPGILPSGQTFLPTCGGSSLPLGPKAEACPSVCGQDGG